MTPKEPMRWIPNKHGGQWKRESDVTLADLDAIESYRQKLRRKLAEAEEQATQPRVTRRKGR